MIPVNYIQILWRLLSQVATCISNLLDICSGTCITPTGNKRTDYLQWIRSKGLPSKVSPRPWPRHSGETAKAAISPLFSFGKGKSAAHAITEPSLSTTVNASSSLSSCDNHHSQLDAAISRNTQNLLAGSTIMYCCEETRISIYKIKSGLILKQLENHAMYVNLKPHHFIGKR